MGGRRTFTTEPGNLTNQQSFKYSGLCNAKAVRLDVTVEQKESMEAQDEKKVVVCSVDQGDNVSMGLHQNGGPSRRLRTNTTAMLWRRRKFVQNWRNPTT